MLVCPEPEGGDGPPHMKGVPSGDHPVKQEASDEEEAADDSYIRHTLVFSVRKQVFSYLHYFFFMIKCWACF